MIASIAGVGDTGDPDLPDDRVRSPLSPSPTGIVWGLQPVATRCDMSFAYNSLCFSAASPAAGGYSSYG